MLTADQVRVTHDAVALPDGRALEIIALSEFARRQDYGQGPRWVAQLRVKRAIADNLVICLLPLPGEQAGKFGISLDEALDAAWCDAGRVVAVAPYDDAGEPLTCDDTDLRMFWAEGPVNGLRGVS